MSAGGCSPAGGVELGIGVTAVRGGGVLSSGRADGAIVGFGRGVDSSSPLFGFDGVAAGVSVGDGFFPLDAGVSSASSSSEGLGFFTAGAFVDSTSSFSTEALLPLFPFFFAGFGLAAGEADFPGVADGIVCISSRALRNASRFFLSSSLICACNSDVTTPVSAPAAHSHVARRAKPLLRSETGCSFKRAEAPRQRRHRASRRAPVPGEELRSISRRAAAASTSDTSR